MNLPFQFTFNSVLMILIGLGLMGLGVRLMLMPSERMFGGGVFLIGIGNLFFGLTNGFTNMTPTGRLLFRFALAAYALGIPIAGYFLLGFLSN